VVIFPSIKGKQTIAHRLLALLVGSRRLKGDQMVALLEEFVPAFLLPLGGGRELHHCNEMVGRWYSCIGYPAPPSLRRGRV